MNSYQSGLLEKLRSASRSELKTLTASLELDVAGWIHIWLAAWQLPGLRAFSARKALSVATKLEEFVYIAESVRERSQRKACEEILKRFDMKSDSDIDLLIHSTCRRLKRLGRCLASRKRLGNAMCH